MIFSGRLKDRTLIKYNIVTSLKKKEKKGKRLYTVNCQKPKNVKMAIYSQLSLAKKC